jgi:hypothetical protein
MPPINLSLYKPIRYSERGNTNTCGHPDRDYYALGKCHACYMQAYYAGEISDHKTVCGHSDRPHYALGLCLKCYRIMNRRKGKAIVATAAKKKTGRKPRSVICGHDDRPHYAYGLCQQCYDHWAYLSFKKAQRQSAKTGS